MRERRNRSETDDIQYMPRWLADSINAAASIHQHQSPTHTKRLMISDRPWIESYVEGTHRPRRAYTLAHTHICIFLEDSVLVGASWGDRGCTPTMKRRLMLSNLELFLFIYIFSLWCAWVISLDWSFHVSWIWYDVASFRRIYIDEFSFWIARVIASADDWVSLVRSTSSALILE